ncbi:MAG: NAD(P)H-hydrate dehydratase [Tannerella sp.]|jgi:NAD(P)H-hydrate epimerase|nr:NAD(P)H-hydrate dehydratase [Tannerella sp.]
MKKIFEASQIKGIDRYTVENEPIASIDLVERAATVFVNEFCRHFTFHQNRICIFAGQGNNGADALAISRILTEKSYNVYTYLINPANMLSPDCEENKRRIKEGENKQFTEIIKEFVPPSLTKSDIIIDGLFGSGLNRPLEGGYAEIVKYINNSKSTVVSIDIPSGLFGEDNRENNPEHIIQADLTLTFEFPKLSFLFPENAAYAGEWKILPIGLHPDALKNTKSYYGLITEEDIPSLIRPRHRFTHKGDYGHALLLVGGKGKMGAAVLAANSCLRSGVGLLTTHIPGRGENIMQISVPESIVSLDTNSDYISMLPDLSKYNAVGIGPGTGTENITADAFETLIQTIGNKPLVIDADALNIIAQKTELLKLLPAGTILTPHSGEFDRIAGASECEYERIQKAREIANEQKICIVLKGAYTAVCIPSGKVFFNTTGNSGMATAGSGDVLTGILSGLLAQGYSFEAAAVIGVYMHGLAGNLAAKSLSQESMLAGDIVKMLGKAFLQMVEYTGEKFLSLNDAYSSGF